MSRRWPISKEVAYMLQHQLMDSATRRPGRSAVAAGGRSLIYSELDRLTKQVARACLSGQGGGRG
jgi:non-ribosomal peptide synthetase component E (peptide arylation enzyme)